MFGYIWDYTKRVMSNERGFWSPIIAALIGAGAAAGMQGKNKGGSIETASTLDGGQQELMNSLATFLNSRIGKGLPGYTGEMVAGESPYETAELSKLGDYMKNTPDIQTFGLNQYKTALSGMDPAATSEWYNKYVMPEQKRMQEEVTIPGVREAYAGPMSAYYSGDRMGAEAGSWNQFGTTQQAALGNAIMSERQSARSMLPYLTEMSALQGGMPQIEAGMTYGSLPRVLEQARLTAAFEEFKRITPELSPVIDQVLSLLGVTTQAAYGQGGNGTSPFASMLSAAGPMLGPMLGQYMSNRDKTTQTTQAGTYQGQPIAPPNYYKSAAARA